MDGSQPRQEAEMSEEGGKKVVELSTPVTDGQIDIVMASTIVTLKDGDFMLSPRRESAFPLLNFMNHTNFIDTVVYY